GHAHGRRGRRPLSAARGIGARSQGLLGDVPLPQGRALSPESMTERWHIMDFGLSRADGHHYWGARAISSELRRRRVDVPLYGNESLAADLTGMRIVPLFRPNMYLPVSDDPTWLELETFVMHNWLVQQDLARLGRAEFAGATVLFPTITYNQFLAVGRWIATFAPSTRPKAVLVLMFPPEWKCWPGG